MGGQVTEEWHDVPGWPGYQVSNLGNVSSTKRWRHSAFRLLRPGDNGKGYQFVHLWRDGHKQRFYVHRLVADAFLGEPPEDRQVNHKNGCKSDNRAENLEYVTRSENAVHARTVLGRRPNTVLTPAQVRAIRDRYAAGGETHKSLAKEMGVAEETVRFVVIRHTWKHIA